MVLTGADPAFCAGMDLKALATELRSVQQNRQRGPLRHTGMLPPHETPVIGAINGATVTGGLELAMGCDFLIASERARFADTHARVGAMPGGGMTIRLPQLIGIDRARRMSFTGDYIDAETARDWGLVVEVVPHDALAAAGPGGGGHHRGGPGPEHPRIAEDVRGDRRDGRPGRVARRGAGWSRRWMDERFDQSRLSGEREAILARGRAQSTGLDGTPA